MAYLRQLRDLGEEELFFDKPMLLTRDQPISPEPGDAGRALQRIADQIRECTACPLHRTRRNTVPGAGSYASGLVLVGEAPGGQEDQQGFPFVGVSGKLLRRLFLLAGIPDDQYFLLNLVKCRPPGNRDPEPEEVEACRRFTEEQIRILRPRLIVGLGRFAGRYLLKSEGLSLWQMRGKVHMRNEIPVVATYHPSALLHQVATRPDAWRDIKMIRRTATELGILSPRPQKDS